jgi:hypothetical protein
MVGLTGRGAADAWRNGPGAVGEYLMAHDPRPDYVAAYTTARGLNYLADTGIYGELLAGFSAEYDPADNVALGAEFQGIFRPDWSDVETGESYPLQGGALAFYVNDPSLPGPAFVVDSVDVADLDSETAHNYAWEDTRRADGFATEVYQFDYVACPTDFQRVQAAIPGCTVIDGGRRISGTETFRVEPQVIGTDAVLITRVHPASRGSFDVYVNGVHVGTRVIPEIPGRWLEIPTYIPAELVDGPLDIHIVPNVSGRYYMPYRHWLMQGFAGTIRPWREDVLVTFQDGALQLVDLNVGVRDEALTVQLGWQTDGNASGDYVVLLHVYDDINSEPVAQTDLRPGTGALPPGNWLPRPFSDTFVVDLSGVPPGQYTVMIGLYAPESLERLVPAGVQLSVDEASRRVFIGVVDIP